MELHYLELLELTRLLHKGELSCVDVTRSMLDRIEKLEPKVHSYVTVTGAAAIAAAERCDAEIKSGHIRGPLHGAPIAIKDLFWTKDEPTTLGTKVRADFIAEEEATVVSRLRDAGAIILGKLKLTEGAYTDHHPGVARPLNPWNGDHWVGGSSSGSGAATAAGLCFGSLGTDTGGSIRFPSGVNGLTGLKPTWGRVSRHGSFALAQTLDHVGPMTRSAIDAAAMLGVIAGRDDKDPTTSLRWAPDYIANASHGAAGLRLGIDERWLADTDEQTAAVLDHVRQVASQLGMAIVSIAFPDPAQIVADWFPLCGAEVAVEHEDAYPSRKEEYGPSLAGLIELGRSVSGTDYQKFVLRRLDFTGRVARIFETTDLILAPVQGFSAPTTDWMTGLGTNPQLVQRLHQYASPFNTSGNPTITLPGGLTEGGMPIGFQFIADHWREDLLVRAGVAFQGATNWHQMHPPV